MWTSGRVHRTHGLAVVVAAASGMPCGAQCTPQWSGYPGPQLDNGVRCLTTYDPDGSGPAQAVVVAGGNFEHVGTQALSFVGAWDGVAWQPLGGGVDGGVRCAAIFGTTPSTLVIGGTFARAGQTTAPYVAGYRNGQWLDFAGGVGGSPVLEVDTVTAFGGDLAVGGNFYTAGGNPALGLAWWNGSSWRAFADERAAAPDVLSVQNGVLYAGGYFTSTGVAIGVFKWQDPQWVTMGTNFPNDDVWAFATFQGQLIAAGDFTNSGNNRIARWDGASWQPLGTGLNAPVHALCVFDPDGPGPMPPVLIAGGTFNRAGGQIANCIAQWDGAQWSALGAGTSGGVRAMTVWNNQLVVAGDFYMAGGIVSPGMAFWGCPQPTPCYANCDQSTTPPVLNVGDFICFMSAFSTGSPYANCDHSTIAPAMNVGDFICFMSKYAQGCP